MHLSMHEFIRIYIYVKMSSALNILPTTCVGVMHCVAVCCSVLQCAGVCCSVLHRVALCCTEH